MYCNFILMYFDLFISFCKCFCFKTFLNVGQFFQKDRFKSRFPNKF